MTISQPFRLVNYGASYPGRCPGLRTLSVWAECSINAARFGNDTGSTTARPVGIGNTIARAAMR